MSDDLPALPETGVFVQTFRFEYEGNEYQIEGNKLYNSRFDVAVVYSPGYGGGWSSWAKIDATDARVAFLTLIKGSATFDHLVMDDPDHSVTIDNGAGYLYSEWHGSTALRDELAISWLPEGTLYRVTEYDGFESIETMSNIGWSVA